MLTATRTCAACCAALAAALLCSSASAITIPAAPGDYTLPGLVIPQFSGPIIFTANNPYSGNITTLFTVQGQQVPQVVSVSGTLRTTVVRDTASGNLDYYYAVFPSDNTYLGAGLTLDNLPTDQSLQAVAWFTALPAQDRTLTVLSPGDIHTSTASLLIHTSLTTFVEKYAPAQVQLSNGIAGQDTVATQALIPASPPNASVPEPATLSLLSLALTGLLWKTRRSRTQP
ncbi:MAG TPA: PEP-CTERM sorting domain-containing protein [Phycisphaerae bacterium]|nr:PEP-CTERM sorting domain-containing protein [Phycisphaerae bacterium]